MDVLIENNKKNLKERNISNCKLDKIYINMVKMLNKIKSLCNIDKEIKYLYNSTCFISLKEKNIGMDYICKIFEIDEKSIYYVKSENIDPDKINTYILNDKINNDNCKNNLINKIKEILYLLKNGNNIIFEMYIDEIGINILYKLSLIFSKVIIIYGRYILCIKIDDKSKYIRQFERKDTYLEIESKHDVDKLKKYLSNMYKEYEKIYKSVLEKNENMVYKISYHFYNNPIIFIIINDKIIKKMDKDNILQIYLERFFIETSRRFFINHNKNNIKEIKIHSAIKKEEGENIQKIIKKYNLNNCLEIGMAYGISAFYILSSKKDIKLTSIDPYQKDEKQWNSMGIKLLQYVKLNKRHNLIEELSYIGLPKLLNKNKSYDFIFIDGWHTFDYTLLDFFYADKLLKLGGIIVIDDVLHKGVNKCIKYVETNYKNYKKIETSKTQAGYIKIGEDKREWYNHVNF